MAAGTSRTSRAKSAMEVDEGELGTGGGSDGGRHKTHKSSEDPAPGSRAATRLIPERSRRGGDSAVDILSTGATID